MRQRDEQSQSDVDSLNTALTATPLQALQLFCCYSGVRGLDLRKSPMAEWQTTAVLLLYLHITSSILASGAVCALEVVGWRGCTPPRGGKAPDLLGYGSDVREGCVGEGGVHDLEHTFNG